METITLEQAKELMKQNGGNLDLSFTHVQSLPKRLSVAGDLDLSFTPIQDLPKRLSVGGDLDLRGTLIQDLPKRLSVGGDLNLRGTLIQDLPKGLTVGGRIYPGERMNKLETEQLEAQNIQAERFMKIQGLERAIEEYQRVNADESFPHKYGALMYDEYYRTLWANYSYDIDYINELEADLPDHIVNLGHMMEDRGIAVTTENVKAFIEKNFAKSEVQNTQGDGRTVDELNPEEIDELKQDLYYHHQGYADDYFDYAHIPDAVVKAHFQDTVFVNDDFFCNMPEEAGGCVLQAEETQPVQEAVTEPEWEPEM